MELLLSSDFPSFLLQGLPFAYISNKSHVITHTSMRHSTAIPSGLALTKRYYKPHIETIERRFVDVRALGGPSVEEWIKGLAEQGQQRVNAIIQWEQYEIKSGLKIMNTPSQPKHMTDSTVLSQHIPPSRTVKSDTLLERFIPRVLGLQPTKGGNYVNPLPPKKLTSSFTGPKIISKFLVFSVTIRSKYSWSLRTMSAYLDWFWSACWPGAFCTTNQEPSTLPA